MQIQHLQSLLDIGQAINAATDLGTTLEHVVLATRDLLGVEHASIVLWDANSERFQRGASTNVPQIDKRVRRRDGASRWIIDNAKPLYVDIRNDPFDPNPLIREHQIMSYLGMPIIHDEKPLGVLYALSQLHRSFDAAEESALQAVAAMSATAIQRAHLVASLRLANDTNAALLQVTAQDVRANLADVSDNLAMLVASLEEPTLVQHRLLLATSGHLMKSMQTLDLLQKYEQASYADPDKVVCDLNLLVTTASSMLMSFAQAKTQQVSLHLSSELSLVHADPVLIQEAILQLGQVAISHSDEGSHVALRVETCEDCYRIVIMPAGMMSQTQGLEHLSQGHDGSQPEPVSLGLLTAKVIAEKHQGQLEVERDVEPSFILILPAYR